MTKKEAEQMQMGDDIANRENDDTESRVYQSNEDMIIMREVELNCESNK